MRGGETIGGIEDLLCMKKRKRQRYRETKSIAAACGGGSNAVTRREGRGGDFGAIVRREGCGGGSCAVARREGCDGGSSAVTRRKGGHETEESPRKLKRVN
ncbi:hypothetical protein NL676_038831 [Syzygium grande]|nr:hypothetical protein NL676_038831 [Syzygium grande]